MYIASSAFYLIALFAGAVQSTTLPPQATPSPAERRILRGNGWVTTSRKVYFYGHENPVQGPSKGHTVVDFDIFADPPILPPGMSLEDFKALLPQENDKFDLS